LRSLEGKRRCSQKKTEQGKSVRFQHYVKMYLATDRLLENFENKFGAKTMADFARPK
jgi:hypothetical protein